MPDGGYRGQEKPWRRTKKTAAGRGRPWPIGIGAKGCRLAGRP